MMHKEHLYCLIEMQSYETLKMVQCKLLNMSKVFLIKF